MKLERLDPSDDKAHADVLELETAAGAVDEPYNPPPPPIASRVFRLNGWDGEPGEDWLYRDGSGQVIGKVGTHLPKRENVHVAFGGVLVHPEHRRQGIGRRLFQGLRELVGEPGRRVLVSHSLDQPTQRGFAEGLGFHQASVDIHRRQDLKAVDWDRVDRLRAEAREAASGYSLLRLDGPVPDELVDDVLVMEAAINDAPRDDLDLEDSVGTAERLRTRERISAEAGVQAYRLIARRDRDGRLAGHTMVFTSPEQPEYGGQGDTSVLAEHRGHRLGMLLKTEMMFWISEVQPQVRWVDTGNAESNRHMIAINEALDYEILARHVSWQRDL